MDDIRKLIEEVLAKGRLISLATIDESGPWVSDVIYIHDDALNLYWISKKERRHSMAIKTNPKVACSITVSTNPREKDLGVQIEGLAEELNQEPQVADSYWKKRNLPKTNIEENVAWYVIHPKKIQLINEALFGYEKKILTL